MQISPPQISWSPGRDHHHNHTRPARRPQHWRSAPAAACARASPPRAAASPVDRASVRTLAQGLGDLLIADETLQRGEPVTPARCVTAVMSRSAGPR